MPVGEEEWTVVTASDKKRVMRKPGRRRKLPPPSTAIHADAVAISISDSDTINACLQDCIEYIVKTDLWKMLVETLDQVHATACCRTDETRTRIRQIVAYGIGNFFQTGTTYYSAPLWQLALVVCLRTHLTGDDDDNPVSLVYFDPCSSADEETFIAERLDGLALTVNDRGNHPVNQKTLFFMPHCPAQLYEHVVWSNYDAVVSSLSEHKVMFVGNSLRRLAESTDRRILPCLQALLPCLHESELIASATDCKDAPGNLVGAVNDTFVSYYCRNSSDADDLPQRPYQSLEQDDTDPELL